MWLRTGCAWCERMGRWCKWPLRVVSVLLNLLFLPDWARRWVFNTGTRALEGLNALMLLGWGAVIGWSDGLTALPSYSRFAAMPQTLACLLFLAVGALLAGFLPSESPRSNVISGWLLLAAAMLWGLVTAGFWGGYPPLNTAMVVYPILAIVSWWAGILLIENSKHELNQK